MRSKSKRAQRRGKRSAGPTRDAWKTLVSHQEHELAGIDVALVNLSCSVGLPGSEELHIPTALEEVDRLAARVKRETARNRHCFIRERRTHGDSRAKWTAGMLVTVLQQDCGVRYNPKRIHDPDFRDARDLFIHGMLGFERPGGTCASMPFLYVAVGRRLGYPMFVATAQGHLYVRWDDPEGTRWRERDSSWRHGDCFNLEGAANGFHIPDDTFYHNWPHKMSETQIASKKFLSSMSRREELACLLASRGHCLEDNGQLAEAVEVYQAATDIEFAYSFFLANARIAASSPVIQARLQATAERKRSRQTSQADVPTLSLDFKEQPHVRTPTRPFRQP